MGIILIVLGTAIMPPVLVMDRWAIRNEEQHLEARFGEEYRRYKSTVRRWL